MTTFNAWRDPWVPLQDRNGEQIRLSLRDTFVRAHDLAGLGAGLTPLDRDSLYRFLPSVGAVILRLVGDDALPNEGEDEGWSFPEEAVDQFGALYEERFELTGDRPFLQRWDRKHADLEALFSLDVADPKVRRGREKARSEKLQSLHMLHPHTPGGSSSQWAVRRDTRDETQCAELTLLLVTTWFQTKHGNSKDPWGHKSLKGSAGTWHVNPFAVHLTDPRSLARTLCANMPYAWIDGRNDLPLFLDHESLPRDFATAHVASVTRFTYAKTLPLVYVEDGAPVGFVIGEDPGIPVPGLGKDDKTSLGMVHEFDHTRLYLEQKSGDLKPRGAFGVRLTTTEGFERWFRAENQIRAALDRWARTDRVLTVSSSQKKDWLYSLYSDNGNTHGNREFAAWDELPADVAGASGDALERVRSLLTLAAQCRNTFGYAMKLATGDSRIPPAAEAGQAAFYAGLVPVLAAVAHAVHEGEEVDMRSHALALLRIARREFDRTTAPMLVPSAVARVAHARAEFARLIAKACAQHFPAPASSPEQETS
ncbi:type I-E CRISPR-associated protein Cse1/CasA [Nocardioides yefusunii]|uniref:Type I-E CRISPR-associated protein Cse1/CasA n=1 Tax=Nocardioides yefusunii TaxID=2500546 RepID=A0ABW1R1Q7_9ACTN|nr:type I-E CRISPR-associated protein Cse1/CasA [Nocardioides yefusunii]